MLRFLFLALFLTAAALPAVAQDSHGNAMGKLGGGNKEPIDISADQSLEWDQTARTYAAKGNAIATRGPTHIAADLLVAHERDVAGTGSKKETEVWKLTAENNVVVTNERTNKAGTAEKTIITGERGVYDVDRDVAVLTGSNLKLDTGKDTITASERFEYWSGKNIAVAVGNVEAISTNAEKGQRHIKGDTMTALFSEDANGELQAERVEVDGNVVILTATDIATGKHAVYDLHKNKALLTGNVQLTRGKNQLAGDKAEVDFTTGISKLLNTGKTTRVRGILFPDKKTAPAAKEKSAP